MSPLDVPMALAWIIGGAVALPVGVIAYVVKAGKR